MMQIARKGKGFMQPRNDVGIVTRVYCYRISLRQNHYLSWMWKPSLRRALVVCGETCLPLLSSQVYCVSSVIFLFFYFLIYLFSAPKGREIKYVEFVLRIETSEGDQGEYVFCGSNFVEWAVDSSRCAIAIYNGYRQNGKGQIPKGMKMEIWIRFTNVGGTE